MRAHIAAIGMQTSRASAAATDNRSQTAGLHLRLGSAGCSAEGRRECLRERS